MLYTMSSKSLYISVLFLVNIAWTKCDGQVGPDPWDYVSNINTAKQIDEDLPSDLKTVPARKVLTNNVGTGEWFYKRILAIILKGGAIKKNEDGSVDISLQMRYSPDRWKVLDEYITPNAILTTDMCRRSMGYIEEAIYKPTITEKIVMAWTEHIQFYLIEYKVYIVWTTSILAGIITLYWLLHNISNKHVVIIVFIGFYMYEVFVSYKEAEKQELDRFINAMNTCKWLIWSSTCEVPPPDSLIFLKHMNPLKIGVRMFSVLLSEPTIIISETVKTISCGITDGLWFPFDKIMYGFLMLVFNAAIIFLLVMIIFNYILNIPFNLNLLGIVNIGLKQRYRKFSKDHANNNTTNAAVSSHRNEDVDRISGETLSRLLDVCSKALNTTQSMKFDSLINTSQKNANAITYKPTMTRSASTGRLPNIQTR